MRRFILLLMLCVLPLQFALAAAVDARDHAGSGHSHEAISYSLESDMHAAQSDTDDTADTDESASRAHGECGACHFVHSLAFLETRAEVKPVAAVESVDPHSRDAHHRNAATERPERPNWIALV